MWSPQSYISRGREKNVSEDILNNAVEQIQKVSNSKYELPGILSLKHLAIRTGTTYNFLRGAVSRKRSLKIYNKFSINKRSGGRRFIHVPTPELMKAQKWINIHILRSLQTHKASFAFTPGSSIYKCASQHCGAQWLIKMDITGFFESISEIQVHRVFKGLGYSPLVSFELTKICTIGVKDLSLRRLYPSWLVKKHNKKILMYSSEVLGYLPQGAPTSPMLSNLVMHDLDEKIECIAARYNLTYTRYSDDLTFSTRGKNFNRSQAQDLIAKVSKDLLAKGFRPQHRKTTIIPPGSRKIVLGLQVDGDFPRLKREFKDNLRQHFYYLEKHCPVEHAQRRGFESVSGLKNHIKGLVDYAKMIEPQYAEKMMEKFNNVEWPI